MSTQYEQNGLIDGDWELLKKIEEILANEDNEERGGDSLYSFCARLARAVPQSDNNFEQQLESRLIAKFKQQKEVSRMNIIETKQGLASRLFPTRSRWRIALGSALALILLLVGTVVVDPSARAWAQGPLNDLLSYFGFSRQPRLLPIATVIPATPSRATTQTNIIRLTCDRGAQADGNYHIVNVQVSFNPLTRAQIQPQAGFPVKTPVYLPTNYCGMDVFEFVTQTHAVLWTGYRIQNSNLCFSDIRLSQSRVSAEATTSNPVGTAPATAVTVAGVPGLWIEKVDSGSCNIHTVDGRDVVVTLYDNILTWDHDGIRYRLTADANLGLSEMLKIAESLK